MQQKAKKPFTDKKGIALLPIILVLLVVASLIAVGVTVFAPQTKKIKITETKDIIEAAVDSIMSWATANSRLPNSSEFPTVVRNPNDAWTKSLVYIYDNNLTNPSTGGLCGRGTTAISAGSTSNIAFIIISGGDDYTVNSSPNVSGAYSGSATVSSDDITRVVTLKELKNKAGCYGTVRGRLMILNNELPYYIKQVEYLATIYADGGVPFGIGGSYRWCRQGKLPSGLSTIPDTTDTLPAGCTNLGEGEWVQANVFTIHRTPAIGAEDSYEITFFVRDDNDPSGGNDNIAQRTLVMIVIPPLLTVRNSTGARHRYILDNGNRTWWETDSNISVSSPESILYIYTDAPCNTLACSKTYSDLKAYDLDGDNRIQMMPERCSFDDW